MHSIKSKTLECFILPCRYSNTINIGITKRKMKTDPHKHKTSLVNLAVVHTSILFLGDCFTGYSSSMPLHTSLFCSPAQPLSFILSFSFYNPALIHKGAICLFSWNLLLPSPVRPATVKITSYQLLIVREKKPRFQHSITQVSHPTVKGELRKILFDGFFR